MKPNNIHYYAQNCYSSCFMCMGASGGQQRANFWYMTSILKVPRFGSTEIKGNNNIFFVSYRGVEKSFYTWNKLNQTRTNNPRGGMWEKWLATWVNATLIHVLTWVWKGNGMQLYSSHAFVYWQLMFAFRNLYCWCWLCYFIWFVGWLVLTVWYIENRFWILWFAC